MGLTRNQRRKVARERLLAKSERIAKAELARQADERRALVQANKMAPKPERNAYPASCLANMQGSSHRAYICRAGGQMPHGRALALKAQGKW